MKTSGVSPSLGAGERSDAAVTANPTTPAGASHPDEVPAGTLEEASGYTIEARLPDGETIEGAKTHRSMESVRRQLRRTAPQWRQVFPGVTFRILSETANAARNGPVMESRERRSHDPDPLVMRQPGSLQEVKHERRRSRK